MRENRETPVAPAKQAGRSENPKRNKSEMNVAGESHSGIVPAKQPNKSERSPAEVVEGRPLTKENTQQLNPYWTPSRESGSSGLERVREAAKRDALASRRALRRQICTYPR